MYGSGNVLLIRFRHVDNKLGVRDELIEIKDNIGLSPRFHEKIIPPDPFRSSVGECHAIDVCRFDKRWL